MAEERPMSGQATEQIEGVQPLLQSREARLFLKVRNTAMLNSSTSAALRTIRSSAKLVLEFVSAHKHDTGSERTDANDHILNTSRAKASI